MKRLTKFMVGSALVVAILGSSAAAFAQTNVQDAPQRGPGIELDGSELEARRGGRRGAGGEVTAVGTDSLTIQNRNGESVTVNVDDDTTIQLVESQTEGSLSDIAVGDNVKVRGQRNDDGSVDARAIVVAPDGDKAGGQVTAVDGSTITVEGRDGETTTITVDGDTEYRLGRDGETGSLADITTDSKIRAYGELQDDGSLDADLIFIGQGGERGNRTGNSDNA